MAIGAVGGKYASPDEPHGTPDHVEFGKKLDHAKSAPGSKATPVSRTPTQEEKLTQGIEDSLHDFDKAIGFKEENAFDSEPGNHTE